MIIPGNIFKFNRHNTLIATVLVLINVIVYLLVKNMNPESNGIKEAVLELVNHNTRHVAQKMYVNVEDKDLQLERSDKIKINPLAFFSDLDFWTEVQSKKNYNIDSLQEEKIRQSFTKVQKIYKTSPQYTLGLTSFFLEEDIFRGEAENPYQKRNLSHQAANELQKTDQFFNVAFRLLTYQFLHLDFLHLFVNVAFLFLVVTILEKTMSAQRIILLYLLGGMGAGVFYLMLTQDVKTFSLVGASGSICALTMYLVCEYKGKNIPWTYFFSSNGKKTGIIYLPAYLFFTLFLLSDFVQVFIKGKSVSQLNVAYAAHVGGAIMGLILYFLIQGYDRYGKKREVL